jgi:Mycothiol maleylpyruvate isomerase N-terminal domain
MDVTTAVPIDRREARDALTAAADRTADLVSSITDLTRPIPGLRWSVGDAAAHLTVFCLPAFTDAVRGEESRWEPYIPPVESFHERLAEANDRTIHDAPVRDGAELARMIHDGTVTMVEALDARGGEGMARTPWYGSGSTMDLAAVTCLMLGELLVHGHDIARGLRRRWPIEPAHARLVVAGVFPAMIPLIVDRRSARGLTATYEIRVWDGPRFVNRFAGGQATAEACAGQRIDCHLSGDPVELLLVGYGRKRQWGPIARGRLRAWGRRPWLGLRWKSLYEDP